MMYAYRRGGKYDILGLWFDPIVARIHDLCIIGESSNLCGAMKLHCKTSSGCSQDDMLENIYSNVTGVALCYGAQI